MEFSYSPTENFEMEKLSSDTGYFKKPVEINRGSESLNFNNTYHCEILGKPIIRMAKTRKKVSDTARPDKIDENEFRNFKSTRSDNRVPKIPKIEMDVSVTPSR